MASKRCVLAGLAGISWFSAISAAQDGAFRTWFEAPETVIAGETFQVWMWATYEENGAPATDGWFNGVRASIEVSGELDSFSSISEVLDGLPFRPSVGQPDGPWLRDFLVFQTPSPGVPFDDGNPLPVLMFEIATSLGAAGELNLDLRAASDQQIPLLTWWDSRTGDWIQTTDPGIGLDAATGTVRVIPAPAPLGLLALAGLGAVRRRR